MKDSIKQQTEEMKNKIRRMGPVKIIILILLAVGTVCSYVFHDKIFVEDSIFNRGITDSEFLNGLLALVPKIIRAVQIVTIILVVTAIVLGIINRVFKRNQREITVVRLISNMIRCVVAVVLVIAVLAIWGIDTTALINNSDIRGVLNQTVNPSTAKALVDIEYGESLERVEEIIATKLPEIKIEGVIDSISYDGVAALGASGVTLQFTASCYEGDIFAVQREMNKKLKNMFDENGVGIPFNQLVVHMADETAAK